MNDSSAPDATQASIRQPVSGDVRVGIVGAGAIAAIHRDAIAGLDGVTVTAVTSTRRPSDAGWARVPFVEGFEALVRSPLVDVVCVCTPSGSHARMAIEALEAGKHVVVEKPLSLEPATADRVVQVARDRSLLAVCISPSRYEPQLDDIAALATSGRLGRPVLAEGLIRWYRDAGYYERAAWRGTWSGSGGVLANQGYHTIDLMCWLLGPADAVRGFDARRGHDIEAADTAVAAITFASGALGVISASTAAYPGVPECLNLFYDRGFVRVEGGGVVQWAFEGVPMPGDAETHVSGASDPIAIGTLGHERQWRDVVAALRDGRDPRFTAADAVPVVRLLDAARGSRA